MAKNRYLTLILILFLLLQLKTFGSGQNKIDSLKTELNNSKDETEQIENLWNITKEYATKDLQLALTYAQKAYDLSHKISDHIKIAQSAIYLADVYGKYPQVEPSLKYIKEAQAIAKKTGSKDILAQTKISEANLYLLLFDLEKSMDLFYESFKLSEELNDKISMHNSLNGIGIIYLEQRHFLKAREVFNKCLAINEEIGNPATAAVALNNIASTYSGTNDLDKSIHYYSEALEINKKNGNKNWEGLGYLNLSGDYLLQNNHQLALQYLKKAGKIENEIKNDDFTARYKVQLARHFFNIDKLDSCILHALDAYKIAKEIDANTTIVQAVDFLHKSYKKTNDFKNAYKFVMIHSNLVDSLNVRESVQKVANIELKYKIEKEEQRRQFELKAKRSRQIAISITAISIFIIIILLLIGRHKIAIKNVKLEKNKIESKLEVKNKELTLNVLTLLKKNDMLTSISQELYDVKHIATKEETKNAINKIANKIKESSESEIWEDFELRFREVHTEFYETIKNKYPDLTSGELRLCALLKLNMSSKEIAQLTGKSLTALEKARYRIRKKMNLSNSSVNLANYLSEI